MSALSVGVLASGEGTNLQALLDTVHGREAQVVAVASDQPGARALARAEAAGVPTAVFALEDYADRPARDAAIADWLQGRDVRLVVLAGYMALLTPGFLARFPGAVLNVHPSLLPAFPCIRSSTPCSRRPSVCSPAEPCAPIPQTRGGPSSPRRARCPRPPRPPRGRR